MLQLTQPGDDPGQQNDDQVTGVGLHPGVFERRDLVVSGRQAHAAFTVQVALGIQVTVRQGERELGLHGHAFTSPS